MFSRSVTGWPASRRNVRWRVPAAIASLLVVQLCSIVWFVPVASAMYGTDGLPPLTERPIWSLLVFNFGLWAAYLLAPMVLQRLTATQSMTDFELRAPAAQLVGAFIVGVATQLAVLPALYWLVLRLIDGDPSRTAEQLVDRIGGPVDIVLLTLAVVVIAPMVEEWFYRGMLLPTFVRGIGTFGPRWEGPSGVAVAAVLSAALFAVVHQELVLLPGLFVFGLLLSWITSRTGRLGPAVAAHAGFNATTLVQLLAL